MSPQEAFEAFHAGKKVTALRYGRRVGRIIELHDGGRAAQVIWDSAESMRVMVHSLEDAPPEPEIVVTPAMVDAGVGAMLEMVGGDIASVAAFTYRAMHAAAPRA